MKSTPNCFQPLCKTALRLMTISIMAGTVASAGTIIYEPDNYPTSYPGGLYSGAITTNYFNGLTLNLFYTPNSNLYGTKITSSSGDRYFAHEFGSNWLASTQIFRGTFSTTTSNVSLDVWGSSSSSCTGILNAYSSGGTLLGSATSSPVTYESSKQTLTVSAAGISYFELVPTVAGGLRADYLTFSGSPTYSSGQQFIGYQDSSAGSGTTAALIGGQATGSRSITSSFTLGSEVNSGTVTLVGDAFNLSGTGSDTFVLQMGYTDQALADLGLSELEIRMMWQDANGDFVNAVLGNSNAETLGESLFVEGVYNPAIHTLGHHGVDADSNTVWAVLDHNSTFGIGAVPEPSSWGLLLVGIGGAALFRRRPTAK